jgi:hypothetical protein
MSRLKIDESKSSMNTSLKNKLFQKMVTGYRPAVYGRQGPMLGIRQPLDGPVFEKLEDASNWCIHAMISHFDRRLGIVGRATRAVYRTDELGAATDPGAAAGRDTHL